jgi:predicted RecA/RadA family phage recombinase
MLTQVFSGKQLNHLATAAITSDQVKVLGSVVGVAADAIASAATGPFLVKGVVKVLKTTTQAWTLGQRIYWDGTQATTVAGSNDFMGVAAAIADSGGANDLVGYVLLNEGAGASLASATITTAVRIGTSAAFTLGYFGTAAGATQAANITALALSGATQATTTEIRAISVAVDALIAAVKTYRLIASA